MYEPIVTNSDTEVEWPIVADSRPRKLNIDAYIEIFWTNTLVIDKVTTLLL